MGGERTGRGVAAALVAVLVWSFAPAVHGDEGPVVHDVGVGDIYFDPMALEARPGDTIRWSWESGSHTVTAYEGATFDSGTRSAGATFEWTYEGGTLGYYCQIHSFISGGECQGAQCGVIDEAAEPPPPPDPDAPQIAVPPESAAFATGLVTVAGSSDPEITVEVRDAEGVTIGITQSDSSGSWSTDLGFADGIHVITAVNVEKAAESPPRTFVVDTVPPSVTITRPTSILHVLDVDTPVAIDQPTAIGPVTVRAVVEQPLSGVDTVSFDVDGETVPPEQITYNAATGEFRFHLRSARLGEHLVTATAVGGSGLAAADTTSVLVIPTGP